MNEACGPRPDPAPVGGHSQEHTDLHFAHAFDGSVARAELALLDPLQQVPLTAATLQRFLTGGQLCLVDVPCGAAAASLALLGTIAELRTAGRLPRLPLNVHIIGGEISAPARKYADDLLSQLKMAWSSQGIFVTHELLHWDVLSTVSNGELVERIILQKAIASQTLVVVCNFNGFLIKHNKKDKAEAQLGELFKFASGLTNAAVWIEPNMNAATVALFPWLKKVLLKWKLFAALIGSTDSSETCDCSFELPAKPPERAAVRLSVVPIDLVKQGG